MRNHGADTGATDFNDFTAIHHECTDLNIRMVKALLKLGFEPETKTSGQPGNRTPLMLIVASSTTTLSDMKRRRAKQKITRILLNAGADPNARVHQGLF